MCATQRVRRAACLALIAVGAGASDGWYADQDSVRVVRPELDIREAGLFRLSDGGLVLRVRCGTVPPSKALRLLFDMPSQDLVGRREAWMIEGDVLYRRAPGMSGWAWDEAGGVVSAEAAYGVRNVLLPPAWNAPLRWAVESLNSDWTVADRLPAQGMIEAQPDRIPELAMESVAPADQRPVIAVPPSLAARWPEIAGGEGWTNDETTVPLPSWYLSDGQVASWTFELCDFGGHVWPLEVVRSAHRGSARRWEGRAGPLEWTLLALAEPDDWTWLGMEVKADSEAKIEVKAHLNLPADGWRVLHPEQPAVELGRVDWTSREMATHEDLGRAGARSVWPLVAATGSAGSVLLACDPKEPAPFLWGSSAMPPRLWGTLPLAIATAGSPVRGRAICAVMIRCGPRVPSYRAALATWHRRFEAGAHRRDVPWQWRLSTNEAAAVRTVLGGEVAVEITRGDEPVAPGTFRCLRLRPWALDLPLPAGWPADAPTALRLLRFLATAGGGAAWYAQAAMVGGVRDATGALVIAPAAERHVRVAVSADPDLMTTAGATWNRAMLEIAALRHAREAGPVHGLVFDAMSATTGLDFNPIALAVADRSLVWNAAGRGPAALRDLDAFKFLSAVREQLDADGPWMAAENPFDHHSTLASLAEIIVVDDELTADPRQGRVWRHRLLAGRRPVVRRLSGDFEWCDPRSVCQALALSTACGMVPSFGTGADGRPYWSVPEWYRRDTAALREWVPLAARLATAGWHLVPIATADDPTVLVETFGGEGGIWHVTAWNRGRAARSIVLELNGPANDAAVMDLRDAAVRAEVSTNGAVRWSVRLDADEVRVFDVVEPSSRDLEWRWLERWGDPAGVGLAAAANARAMTDERARGVRLEIEPSGPFIRGATNVVLAHLHNGSGSPLVVSDVRCGPDGGSRGMLPQPRILAAGETASMEFPVDETLASGATWLLWEWRFQQPDVEWVTRRRTPARWTPPLEFGPLSARPAAPGIAELVVPVRNHTAQRFELSVEWGAAHAELFRMTTVVEPVEARDLTLPATGEPGTAARIEVRVRDRGHELYRGDVRVRFGTDVSLPR